MYMHRQSQWQGWNTQVIGLMLNLSVTATEFSWGQYLQVLNVILSNDGFVGTGTALQVVQQLQRTFYSIVTFTNGDQNTASIFLSFGSCAFYYLCLYLWFMRWSGLFIADILNSLCATIQYDNANGKTSVTSLISFLRNVTNMASDFVVHVQNGCDCGMLILMSPSFIMHNNYITKKKKKGNDVTYDLSEMNVWVYALPLNNPNVSENGFWKIHNTWISYQALNLMPKDANVAYLTSVEFCQLYFFF
ncbi:hypothetical protein RFI_19347, partial [Reticulomyxa filosa]